MMKALDASAAVTPREADRIIGRCSLGLAFRRLGSGWTLARGHRKRLKRG
jgi:hypothetical protein